MDRPLRVALIVPEYQTDLGGQGGVATVADFVGHTVRSAGWQLATYTPRMSRRAAVSRRIFAPTGWFRPLRLWRREDGVYEVGAHVAEIEAVRYLPRRALDLRLARADVVLVVGGSPAICHIARRYRGPIILQVATMIRAERQNLINSVQGTKRVVTRISLELADLMDRTGLKVPDVVLTENEWMTQECLRHGARTVELSPPGVNTDTFRPRIREWRDDDYVLMVSRLGDPRKEWATLFRAYTHARSRGLKCPLVIAGRGTLTSLDDNLLDELHIRPYTTIHQDISLEDLVSLLQRAGLFVLSSAEEGLGLVIVEAMACGLPVLVTETAGAQYAVGKSGCGELVPIGDHKSMGESMIHWMSDEKRKESAGKAARLRAEEVFSLESTGEDFRRIIMDLVQNHRSKLTRR